jgi:hypothetical protein
MPGEASSLISISLECRDFRHTFGVPTREILFHSAAGISSTSMSSSDALPN